MRTYFKEIFRNGILLSVFWVCIKVVTAQERLPAPDALGEATFAAGCFWCVEADFDKLDGVIETISGYTGGHTLDPTYESVGSQKTGHVEAVRIHFNPKQVTYQKLLDHYWHNVDFLDGEGQFCDRGSSYRPVIFTHSAEQEKVARNSKKKLEESGKLKTKNFVTIEPAGPFTPAEQYHQDYYKKNPIRYHYYRLRCGRDSRLQHLRKLIGSE
ncbi:MAG: peptide-methionine (S)-S-oxide reductase MsrA [Hyphomicrobium sp.]